MNNNIFIYNGKKYNKETSTLLSVNIRKGIHPAARTIIGKRIPPTPYNYKDELYKTNNGNYFMLSYSEAESWHGFKILSREQAIETYFSHNNKLVPEEFAFGIIEEA